MKKRRSLYYPIFIFVVAQLAWFAMIGLWVYRWVTSNMIVEQVSEQLPSQLVPERTSVLALIPWPLTSPTINMNVSSLISR